MMGIEEPASPATPSNHILASGRCDFGVMAVMALGVGSTFGGNLGSSWFCLDSHYIASFLWIWFGYKVNKLGVREIWNVFLVMPENSKTFRVSSNECIRKMFDGL